MMLIQMSNNGMQMHLHMTGHAGYAERGKDIVCAAASMLAQALMAALEGVEGITIRYRAEPGDLELTATEAAETRPMWQMAQAGFRLLGAKYPKNVVLRGAFCESDLVH